MAMHEICKVQVWPYIEKSIQYMLDTSISVDTEIGIGINYSILLNMACYVEGYTESILKELLAFKKSILHKFEIEDFNTRIHYNTFINSIISDIDNRISRATGFDNYDLVYELLTENKLSAFDNIKPFWESVQVLFHLRNVIAHGREINASRLSAYWIDEPYKEIFNGGYKKAESYLKKHKLIDKGFFESESVEIFFTREIVEHFWTIIKQFIENVRVVIDDEVKNKKLIRR